MASYNYLLLIFLYFPIAIHSKNYFNNHTIITTTTENTNDIEIEYHHHHRLLESIKYDHKNQKRAINMWINSLNEDDYNVNQWAETFNGQPANYFEYYAEKLSNIYKDVDARVNFVMVGACDGTNDRTIRDKFLKYNHWRGVFVEPFEINFKDLTNFMETNKASDRAHLIHAAATRQCNSTTIKMKRPTFEEQNKSLPHWMRRQIGAVVPFNKLQRPMTGGWIAEYVRCVTGSDILQDWTSEINRLNSLDQKHQVMRQGKTNTYSLKMVRPHVLKVDVEGHDYDVLMGFLGDNMLQTMLPLMINFEAKSISTKFDLLKQSMIDRGYVVSNFATDGFALLHADNIFIKKTTISSPNNEKDEEETNSINKINKKKQKKSKNKKPKNKNKEQDETLINGDIDPEMEIRNEKKKKNNKNKPKLRNKRKSKTAEMND